MFSHRSIETKVVLDLENKSIHLNQNPIFYGAKILDLLSFYAVVLWLLTKQKNAEKTRNLDDNLQTILD